ncbi:hypothetical protein [Hoeflea sp.]|uniref:hypothetical protein n=1 Tax=Hoeflea sp. TaxID=1940281 RepID=UPI003B01AD68
MGFNPVVINGDNGYDPAKLIALLARDHPLAYLRMAGVMIPRGYGGIENGQYFKDAATALFTGLPGYYAETGARCEEVHMAASPSNQILLLLVDKRHVVLRRNLPIGPGTPRAVPGWF